MTRHPVPTPSLTRQQLGAFGEDIVAEYLVSRGYAIVARNWRCRAGELDLIVRREDTIIAVEVKTRRGAGQGSPLEAVTARKAARLRQLLHEWLGGSSEGCSRIRVDAVGVTLHGSAVPQIDHVEGIS